MDIAIVTGASSSLGLAISRRLIQLGFRVYGLGGDYKDCPLQNVNFKPMACDLADPVALDAACQRILEKEKGVFLVVNNAKFFGRNRFLEMDIEEMERILRINLLCPMVLIRNFAHSLKELQGYIIQLGASYADSSAGGP
ncbi:MAG TPA: SDR family oxidoreductase, partial [Oceanipulchritudo sp.]|nr:SDR family oxidoreductase [Oceanipulchritudo sp.]